MRLTRLVALLLAVAVFAAACTGSEDRTAAFCETLGKVTGPNGVEAVFTPGDPQRIEGLLQELSELNDRAPDEISATTRTLLSFFRSYQRAARDERRDVIAANERALAEASASLDQYALEECGLFLQRVPPTPRPSSIPLIKPPAE
jgi:hypothetical protein